MIATPNFTHRPIAVAAAEHGKHIMCEKPLGLSAAEVREMYHAARDHRVVHMTAFTYRFAPSMRYLKHLVTSGALGTPRHFRSQRFLDWPETSWGWRQSKKLAGAAFTRAKSLRRSLGSSARASSGTASPTAP